MKTITTILAIALFSWIPNTSIEEIKLSEIPLEIENLQYENELEECTFETIYLEEINLDLENSEYLNELEEASFWTPTTIQLEEIPFYLVHNEMENIYELEDVILEEIPLELDLI